MIKSQITQEKKGIVMRKKNYLKYIAVIIIAILLFYRLGWVLESDYDGNKAMDGLYRMEKNTADVIFYGSSHIYAGVNTVDLWNEYGIAGYNLAGTMQTIWNTYYNMVESLKYQTPKVMAVDLYGALIEEEYNTSTNVIKNVSSMKFSLNKIRNVWNSVPHEDFLSYLLTYPLNHDRYRELQKDNYVKEADIIGGKWYKGFRPSFARTQYDELPKVEVGTGQKMPTEKNQKYLTQMVKLAEERQIQLVFIVVPYQGWNQNDEAVYSWIEEFANENDVLFFNGNQAMEKMGFNPATDFAEASHLNYSGACRFTKYMGAWLKDNCSLQDNRGNVLYDSWQQYSDCWEAYQKGIDLAQVTDIEEYIEAVKSEKEYVLLASFAGHYKDNYFLNMFEEWTGVSPYDFENGGTLVIENGNVTYRTPNEPEYLWYMETDSMDIAIVREYGGEMEIWVDNVKQDNDNQNDITLFVYDRRLDKVVDIAAYNQGGLRVWE